MHSHEMEKRGIVVEGILAKVSRDERVMPLCHAQSSGRQYHGSTSARDTEQRSAWRAGYPHPTLHSFSKSPGRPPRHIDVILTCDRPGICGQEPKSLQAWTGIRLTHGSQWHCNIFVCSHNAEFLNAEPCVGIVLKQCQGGNSLPFTYTYI